MKHEHTLEVAMPPKLETALAQTRTHFVENRKPYLFGLGGIILGVAGSRVFSRSTVTQTVIVQYPGQ